MDRRKKNRHRVENAGEIRQNREELQQDGNRISINQQFAKDYEEKKRREFLKSAPATFLAKAIENEGDDSSSEEEDEHCELLTKGIDRRVRDLLGAIKTKDPRIYDKNYRFFNNENDKGEDDDKQVNSDDEPVVGWDTLEKAAKENLPKLTVKDYVRETILSKGNLPNEDDDDEYGFHDDQDDPEQDVSLKPLKPKFKLEESGDDVNEIEGCDDSDDDFFTKREKTKEELEKEEKELDKFMAKKSKKNTKSTGEDILLHSYLENETPDEKERFLRDFVMNNGWIDGKQAEAPNSKDYEIEIDQTLIDGHDDEDEEFDKKVDNFESTYNFRFEQEDGDQIVSHPRNIADSMRRPDERRKLAREAKRERKRHDKLVKDEERKRLKNIKKKEIETRLLAIREAAGNDINLDGFELDLDADFDADKFNRQMEKHFGDEYYSRKDEEMANHLEDECDEIDTHGAIASSRQGIISSSVKEADQDMKKGVQKLINEYYQLDYNNETDGPGGKMRFNYRQVEPESFHLSDRDLLEMDDAELNRLVSVKLLAPYRSNRDVTKQAWRVKRELNKRKHQYHDQRYDNEGADKETESNQWPNSTKRHKPSKSFVANDEDENSRDETHASRAPTFEQDVDVKAFKKGKKSKKREVHVF